MLRILFSESEAHYRRLGLKNTNEHYYVFNGMKHYQCDLNFFEKYDIFVCAFYTMPHNVILTMKFKQLGKRTVIVSDGIFDISNALNNNMHKKYDVIQYHPIIQDYLLLPGLHENCFFSRDTKVICYMPKRIIARENKVEIPKNEKILITTANTAYFNHEEYTRLMILLLGVLKNFQEKNISYAIRIFDNKIIKEITSHGYHIFNDVQRDFEDALKDYSAVISTPSSVVLTSMYHDRAVAQFIYRDTPHILQSGWMLPSIDVFLAFIDDFSPKNEARMSIQQNICRTYLDHNIELHQAFTNIHNVENSDELKKIYSEHVNKQLYNMLQSSFNFNFEYFIRKVYLLLKNKSWIQNLKNKLK